MKLSKIYILLIVFVSCNQQKQEANTSALLENIVILEIQKDKNDINFELQNGVLLFKDEPFSGIVKEFYSEESIKTISQYYKGKRQGFYKGFYEDGNKWFERYYSKGLKSGNHKGWFENGNLMFDYQFNNFGQYHGEVKDWFENGSLQKHFNFVKGKESGSQKMWNVNGKIRTNFYTINGERHGLIGLKKCISVQTKENEAI